MGVCVGGGGVAAALRSHLLLNPTPSPHHPPSSPFTTTTTTLLSCLTHTHPVTAMLLSAITSPPHPTSLPRCTRLTHSPLSPISSWFSSQQSASLVAFSCHLRHPIPFSLLCCRRLHKALRRKTPHLLDAVAKV